MIGSRLVSCLPLAIFATFVSSPPLVAAEEEPAGSAAVLRALARSLDAAGRKMVALAEATPAESFAFRPTPEVRSMSEVYMHVLASNFQIPAALGAPPPEGIEIPRSDPSALRIQRQRWEAEVRHKEAVVGMLRRSFEYATEAIPRVAGLDEIVAPFGFRDTKLDYLLLAVSHAHEHLGQAIAYARSAGVAPPWSEAPQSPERDSVAEFEADTARGRIRSIDRFGNLVTDLVPADLQRLALAVGDRMLVEVNDTAVEVLVVERVTDAGDGGWFAVANAEGTLTLGRFYADAAAILACKAGDVVAVSPAAR